MVTAFAMRNFLKAAVGCLGMIAGCFSTGEAQDFGGMSFGEAGNFGPPQTSGSSKATVISYGEASFVIVTELALPDHWHVYYKNPGTVGLPMEGAFQPVPGFRVEGPFWQIPELGKGLVDFYGYSGKAKMAFRVTPEKDAPPEATFTTTMTWQMCAEQCAAPETRIEREHGRACRPRLGGRAESPDFPGRENRHPAPQDKRTPRSAGFRLFFLQSGGNQPYHSPKLQKTG